MEDNVGRDVFSLGIYHQSWFNNLLNIKRSARYVRSVVNIRTKTALILVASTLFANLIQDDTAVLFQEFLKLICTEGTEGPCWPTGLVWASLRLTDKQWFLNQKKFGNRKISFIFVEFILILTFLIDILTLKKRPSQNQNILPSIDQGLVSLS